MTTTAAPGIASEQNNQPQRLAPAKGAQATRRPLQARAIVRWGFLIFATSIPFDMFPVAGEMFALTKLTGLLFLLLALAQPRLTLRRPPAAFWCFAAYLAIAGLTALPLTETFFAKDALSRLLTAAQMLGMMWIVSNVMQDEELAWKGLVAFYLACVVIALLMLAGVGRTVLQTSRGARLSFGGGNANAVGSTLALGLLIILTGSLASRFAGRWWKVMLVVTGVLLLSAMALTGSRGAVTGTAGGLLAFALHGERLRARMRNLLIFTIAGAFVGYGVYTVFISRARLEEAVFAKRLSGREAIYPETVAMFYERPVLGWGPEANTRELAKRLPFMDAVSLDTHNLYLYVLTECGFVGFIPFLAGLVLCLRAARKAVRTAHGLLPVVLLFAVLAMGLTSNWIRRKPLWFFLGYSLAASSSVRKRRSASLAVVPLPPSSHRAATNAASGAVPGSS